MGNYLGYALKAGVQGFQSGFNMAQKKTEMEWQKKQKKKLEQKEAELMEASSIFNSMVATAGEDGFYSDDEKMKINTAYMALAYEVKGRVDGTYKAIQAMDQKTTEENYQWFDYLKEGVEGLDAKNVEALFNFVEPNITGEKGLQIFEALKNITEKRQGIAKEEQTWKRGATLPADVRTGYLRQEGIDIPEAEVTPKEPTFNEKRFNWKIDQLKAGKITTDQFLKSEGMYIAPEKMSALEKEVKLAIKYGATNEEIKNKLLSKGGGTTTPTSFKTLQTIKDLFKNVKTKVEYDEALASYNTSKEARTSDWTPPSFEGQLTDLIKEVEKAFWADYVSKDGKLKSKNPEEVALYNKRVQQYLALIEEAKRAGMDVSQFQAFIPYESSGFLGLGNMSVISESW